MLDDCISTVNKTDDSLESLFIDTDKAPFSWFGLIKLWVAFERIIMRPVGGS